MQPLVDIHFVLFLFAVSSGMHDDVDNVTWRNLRLCKDRLIACIPPTVVVGVGDEDRPELYESDSEVKHLIHVAFLLVG